jgi:DNA-binding NtrC family response regulator
VPANIDVLILADHTEVGELMAELIELCGFIPVFPRADESAPDAVRRLGARVVLLEWDHEQAGSRSLAEAITNVDSVLLLYSPSRSSTELMELAARCGVEAVTFPVDRSRLRRSLEGAVGSRRSA